MEYTSLLKPPKSKVLKSGRVVLKPGEEVGEHVTENKEEIVIVMKGSPTMKNEKEEVTLKQGETYYVPEGVRHNIINNTDKETEHIYVVSLFKK